MRGDIKPSVCVIGLGYIGLPTAAIIARANCPVLGIDVSQNVVDTINRGEIHIEEVDLDGLVRGVVQRGLLTASTQVRPADVFVIAVPTPFAKDGQHTPDTSYVMAAATEVAGVVKKGDTIILESTCPVGTTEAMRDLIHGLRPDLALPGLTDGTADIAIAYCPERVLPGRILEELTNNDRSIGGITPRCASKALAFYKRFVRGTCVTTDARSAEMTKLTENAYRDVNIAFANELSMIADAQGSGCVGSDPPRQPASARQHPAARPRRGRALHRGRSLVHRPRRARPFAADPHRAGSQRRQDAPCRRSGKAHDCGQSRRAGRVPGPRLQSQYRRFPRKPRPICRGQPRARIR